MFLTEARKPEFDPQDITTPSTARQEQERRFRRLSLRYPVHVKFRSGDLVSELDTVSRNVSAGGFLLDAPALIPQGASVRFVMFLRNGQFMQPVELSGRGTVVRVETQGAEGAFGIAVKCTGPIRQLDATRSCSPPRTNARTGSNRKGPLLSR